MTSAARPETTPADMLVPVKVKYLVPTWSAGLFTTSVLAAAAGHHAQF